MLSKKKRSLILLIIFTFFIISQQIQSSELRAQSLDEVIATINGKNIYLSEFNRLFNSQKRQYQKALDFDPFSKTTNNEIISKRESDLNKAKNKGIEITEQELNNSWNELLSKIGGLENLETKAKENNLPVEDIKSKLKENLLLNKYLDKFGKENLVELMINEIIFLQEAKVRDLTISEEDINKKINFIKQREGSEEAFQKFLQDNAATLEDAKNEIKNQLITQFIKAILRSENIDIKGFLTEKKEKSTIVVYNDKISQIGELPPVEPKVEIVQSLPQNNTQVQESHPSQEISNVTTTDTITLRTKEYPTITKSKVEEIKDIEEKTNEIITQTKFFLPKAFKKEQAKHEEVPLLSLAQQEDLKKSFRERQEIAIEEVREKDGQEITEVKTQEPKVETIQQVQNTKIVEISKLNEPQIVKPINTTKERGKFLSKISNSTKALKLKLSKKFTKKKTKESVSLVPGEEITMKEGLVVGLSPATSKESEHKQTKIQSVDLNTLNALKNHGGLQNIQSKNDFSKELEELRRKIEERRITVNK